MTSDEFRNLWRAALDPWRFLTHYVKTQDPARGVAAFPEWTYVRDLVAAAGRERYLLVPKSRQMLVTWTMVALFVWRAMFRDKGLMLFLSRNERCAEELIEHARFILDNLPPYLRPKLSTNSKQEIAFASLGSRIISLPASPNGPRMYSPNAVFWDEMAFTPYDEQIWTALKPALNSGGRFVGVSSSGGANNLFAKFVQQNKVEGGNRDSFLIPHSLSLFCVHRIHYTMHPEKGGAEWLDRNAAGLSASQWKREYEISFESQSDAVYSEFDPQHHILADDWIPNRSSAIYRSMDFGYHHPFVLWFQETPDGEIVVFDEWSEPDRTSEEVWRAMRNVDLSHGFSERDVVWTACDPAGAAVRDAGISPVDVLRRAGVKLRYRSSRIESGVERVKSVLRDATGRVQLRISPRCRKLIADFNRYHWASQGDLPQKDGLSDHSMDALRYFFVNLDSAREEIEFTPRLAGTRR